MTGLRRHVVAVVAALFALAVGIALGGGPLSYVAERDEPAETSSPDDTTDTDVDPGPSATEQFATLFAASVAPMAYGGRLLGHPTAIVAMPGADPNVIQAMTIQVAAAGGGLTGVFEVGETATDLGDTSLVDSLGSQLVTQLDTEYADKRVDPSASTYVRLGQLIGLAVSTPIKDGGERADDPELAVRSGLAAAGVLTSPDDARLASLVLVVLPPHDEGADIRADAGVYRGLVLGLADHPAGLTVLGDTASGASGLLAELREDDDITASTSTVDGGDTGVGQVTAMLAVIQSLDGSVGAYGASGSDGAVPLS